MKKSETKNETERKISHQNTCFKANCIVFYKSITKSFDTYSELARGKQVLKVEQE